MNSDQLDALEMTRADAHANPAYLATAEYLTILHNALPELIALARKGMPAQEAQPVAQGWLRAVDEALVSSHLGVAEASDSYEFARKKLEVLIDWNIAVATDPAVNEGYVRVPVEPTEAMLDAGHEAGDFHILHYDGTDKPGTPRYSLGKSWKAMLAAAQEVSK